MGLCLAKWIYSSSRLKEEEQKRVAEEWSQWVQQDISRLKEERKRVAKKWLTLCYDDLLKSPAIEDAEVGPASQPNLFVISLLCRGGAWADKESIQSRLVAKMQADPSVSSFLVGVEMASLPNTNQLYLLSCFSSSAR